MGTLQDLQLLLRSKDEQIKALQRQLEQKEEKIQQLRSQLDKYQSVFPAIKATVGPRTQRYQGISAEPHSLKTIQDFAGNATVKHNKSNR